ncbi:MAG: 3,4-dihydroxy-2-butanone-4-phosphate synthase, partial [Phycisphaeraceae bacterium]|nr:3,4-dihydroxy-2-butanone-4-phosphate synthase [Phycisphaeraceae bacterium]
MDSIPDILDDLRAGRMIVLVDDEKRENEGDLVVAAEKIDDQTVNFMLREARGLLCVALTPERCQQLELGPQASVNTAQRSTAFTVSVDGHARHGVTTGVSATDRATTVRLLADPDTTVSDLSRPGHIHPLKSREGGVLVRAGQTEGSVDLCRLAGLQPAAAIIEVMNEDGSMARLEDLQALCDRHDLKMCSVADIIHHRLEREKLIERVDRAPLTTDAGTFDLIAYRSLVDPMPHVALATGRVGQLDDTGRPVEIDEPVLVRMHSQNLLGDVFGDRQHPTGRTLHTAMSRIADAGEGAVVYLRHEKMGT